MLVLNTILVALDEPKLPDSVVEALYQLSLGKEVTLVLSHVMPSDEDAPDRDVTMPGHAPADITYQQIEENLQDVQPPLSVVKTMIEIVSGDPTEEIIRLANIHQADLIILGSRGLTGLKRILQGSVSSQVLEAAPCSVMVIKPRVN